MRNGSASGIRWILLLMRTRSSNIAVWMWRQLGTVAAMMLIVAATCSFFACSDDDRTGRAVEPDPAYAPSRTVMVYVVAENSLQTNVAADVREMLLGMRDSTLYEADRLVVYVDATSLPCIYVMEGGRVEAVSMAELEPVVSYGEDVNSASPEQLGKFIDYVQDRYPAESYGLVMWSHGSGWIPSTYSGDRAASARRRTIGVDNGKNTSSNDGHQMEIEDMARVLEERGGVDFVFFDACFMQCAEVAYALRNATRHIIASPAEIPSPGADYATMARAMFRGEDYVEKMLQAYYATYQNSSYGIVISAVNTEAMAEFAAYMKAVVASHRERLLAVDFGEVLLYNNYERWSKAYPDFADVQGLMAQVLDGDDYAQWQEKVAAVVTCLHTDTWYSAMKRGAASVTPGQCCGMSMFVPREIYNSHPYRYNSTFLDTEWAQYVWDGTGL